MTEGVIFKALSGFYYVDSGETELTECRARGKFRKDGMTPLVGDSVLFSRTGGNKGILEEILPRKNAFMRPAAANIDQMVIFASEAIPVTEPFLIDRITALCELSRCRPLICVNKCDLADGCSLSDIYRLSGYRTIRLSAVTHEGIEELKSELKGKVSVFTGNSGVGKSSVLNALECTLNIRTDDVSEKLGRGRHTTRHVELFRLSFGAVVADTPGFSSFDTDIPELLDKEQLQYAFPEFSPYLDKCRFTDCAHIKEQGCAVVEALSDGLIAPSRHASYVRLYEHAKQTVKW